MARIKGIDIPNDKRVEISLTYIYGIGRKLSNEILKNANVNPDKKVRDLETDELARIREEVSKHLTEVSMNIKTKMEINSYQGIRHKRGLPVRGQRTSRNARTRKGKGKTVANKKK